MQSTEYRTQRRTETRLQPLAPCRTIAPQQGAGHAGHASDEMPYLPNAWLSISYPPMTTLSQTTGPAARPLRYCMSTSTPVAVDEYVGLYNFGLPLVHARVPHDVDAIHCGGGSGRQRIKIRERT